MRAGTTGRTVSIAASTTATARAAQRCVRGGASGRHGGWRGLERVDGVGGVAAQCTPRGLRVTATRAEGAGVERMSSFVRARCVGRPFIASDDGEVVSESGREVRDGPAREM